MAQTPPTWSPDGSLIGFSHEGGVYTIKSDGSDLHLLAGGSGRADMDYYNRAGSPSISPDGTRIAYAAFKHKGWLPWDTDYRWDIVTSALDGSDRRRLTRSDNFGSLNLSPVWSPDGTRIAFLSNPRERSQLGIFTMAADGSDVRSVAPSVARTGSRSWNLLWLPVWSPDGRSLAFASSIDKYVLHTVGVDGSNPARLGNTASIPAWSPDGTRIAFVRHNDAMRAILTVAPDGSDLTVVFDYMDISPLDNPVPFNNLSWSPDGSSIIFSAYAQRVGRGKVGVVDADGSNPRLLASVGRADNAAWSRDGSSIAVYATITADSYPRRPADMASDVPDANVVLFTMKADGSNKRILARYNLDPGGETGRVEAAGGESWYTEYEGGYFKLYEGPYIELKPPDPALMPSGSVLSPAQQMQSTGEPETPPCDASSGDRCVPREVSGFDLFSSGPGGAASAPVEMIGSVEDVLEKGLFLMGASPAHIAFRGTADENSVRCGWRGVARTMGQREEAIRFWLGKDDDEPLQSASQVEADFILYLTGVSPRFRDYVTASFIPIAQGGLSTDLTVLVCYADYTVPDTVPTDWPIEVSSDTEKS